MFRNRLLAAGAAATLAFAAASTHAEAPPKGGQAPGWYRITLGTFEITALSDGTIPAPVDQLLHDIPPARERALLEHAYLDSPVETSVNGFLVNTGSKLVLIDSGAGGLSGQTLGKLVANLKASGYTPEQVDEIYLTHLHGDHVGGITTAAGTAVFPNAVVRADSKEGDYWLSQKNLDAARADLKDSFKGAMASIKPYADAGRFEPFSGATAKGLRRDPRRSDLLTPATSPRTQCARARTTRKNHRLLWALTENWSAPGSSRCPIRSVTRAGSGRFVRTARTIFMPKGLARYPSTAAPSQLPKAITRSTRRR